ncbi:MAG: hypothetical protein AB1791_08535 [Chloroflexota bacterium]
MSELETIVLTSSLTIFGGIVVLVVGELLQKFAIGPVHELRKVIGEIAHALTFYANLINNPGSDKTEKMDEASEALRQLAGQLRAHIQAIYLHKLWELLRTMPKQTAALEAAQMLIGLSNSIHNGHLDQNYKWSQEIKTLLRIKF